MTPVTNLLFIDYYIDLGRLWSSTETLALIMNSSVFEFFILYAFIILSLFANSALRNLIYKVLNLGVMSILIAALWAYTTDLTFIYIVYILAFVGAVVMLFLSVILMLPSSVVASSARLSIFLVIAPSSSNGVSGAVSSLSLIWYLLVTALFTILLIALLKVISLSYKYHSDINLYKSLPVPHSRVSTITPDDEEVLKCVTPAVETYFKTHNFYMYSSSLDNKAGVSKIYNEHSVLRLRIKSLGKNFFATEEFSPLYLVSVPKVLENKNRVIRFILTVIYEFGEYYIRVIEHFFYRYIPGDNSAYAKLTLPLRKFLGLDKVSLRDTLIERGRRLLIVTNESVGRSVPENKSLKGRQVIIVLYTPLWSPFAFLRPFFGSSAWLNFKRWLARFVYSTFSFSSFVEIWSGHLGNALNNMHRRLKKWICLYIDSVQKSAHRSLSGWFAFVYMKSLPCISVFTRLVCTASATIKRLHILFIEIVAQFIAVTSVFFLAVPTPVNFTQFITVDLISSAGIENLKAIQQELYLSSPLLMLLSVISLLVALIGVATIKK